MPVVHAAPPLPCCNCIAIIHLLTRVVCVYFVDTAMIQIMYNDTTRSSSVNKSTVYIKSDLQPCCWYMLLLMLMLMPVLAAMLVHTSYREKQREIM